MNNLETHLVAWYTLVFVTFVVYPMVLVCHKRITNMKWGMLLAWQTVTMYTGYLLNILTIPGM